MSKIGKINIAIPEKVKVLLTGNNINIEGPQGKKSLNIDLSIFDLNIKEGKEVSIKELAMLIKKQIGYEGNIIWDKNKPSGPQRRFIDINKAKKDAEEIGNLINAISTSGGLLVMSVGFAF